MNTPKSTPEMQAKNREVINGASEHQIMWIEYGETWNGIAEVVQVSGKINERKPGRGGETSLFIRFAWNPTIFRLSWRDENLMKITPASLEQLGRYFLHGKIPTAADPIYKNALEISNPSATIET